MKVYNDWIGYLDRNYQTIKTKLLNNLAEKVPEITDHSDSNILVVVIGIFSGIAEMLNYYIDNMARESFITTARKYSSIVKLTRLIDYRIKAMVPSSVDLYIYFYNSDETPFTTTVVNIIPLGTKFTTKNNIEFITISDIIIPTGVNYIKIPVVQKTAVTGKSLGLTTAIPDQVYSIGDNYVDSSITLKIAGVIWNYKETLGRSKPTDRDFIVEISGSKEAYIRFGDNINGAIPEVGQEIVVDYYTSLGKLGNVEINNIVNSSINFTTLFGIPKYVIDQPLKATAGTDYEDIERIRRSAPLSLRTLLRAVTSQDYEDIALLAPGVDKAKVLFNCGKYVYLYISPNGGGIPSSWFLTSVENYFHNKRMVTTFVKALPVGESHIVLNIDVTAKFRMDGIQTKEDIKKVLLTEYSYDNMGINGAIRQSDIYALVDNLPKVDYLKIIYLSVIPYVKHLSDVDRILNYQLKVNIGSITNHKWLIKWDGNFMKLFKDNTELVNLTIGSTYTDPGNVITLNILPGDYEIGDEWEFKTLPVNNDIVIEDYSIPILKEENLVINVSEQLV